MASINKLICGAVSYILYDFLKVSVDKYAYTVTWGTELWNFRTKELSFPGVPWNFRSLELSFPGTFGPWNFRSHD